MPFLARALADLRAVVRDRVPVAAVDAGARRVLARTSCRGASSPTRTRSGWSAPTARCRSAAASSRSLAAISDWIGQAGPLPRHRTPSRSRCVLDAGTFAFSAFMVSRRPDPQPVPRGRRSGSTCAGLARHDGRRSLPAGGPDRLGDDGRASSSRSARWARCSRSARSSWRTRSAPATAGWGDRRHRVRRRDGARHGDARTRSARCVDREHRLRLGAWSRPRSRCSCSPSCRTCSGRRRHRLARRVLRPRRG